MSKIAYCLCVLATVGSPLAGHGEQVRRLPVREYRDKMTAGWIGQMVGVGWGAPTEFAYLAKIIPADKVPTWKPAMVNQFNQDDLYVEMTFLHTLERYGYDVSIRQAGIDFASSDYELWHANFFGRKNLRTGIAPPDSGHPQFNKHADDIDYQIEADYSGLIAPGMPQVPIDLGEKFGRLMNYGDGLYGGQFVGAMYSAAFFESDPQKIIAAGLKCIPAQSQYAEAIRDMLRWHREEPSQWEKTWEKLQAKYGRDASYRRFSCSNEFNIDAKLNGVYIVMGLLYGNRDLDQTTIISCRFGEDSDCNPSNAAGILFTTVGMERLPPRFTSALDRNKKFSHTEYSFPALAEVCEKLARQAVLRAGGTIEQDPKQGEVFVIPVVEPKLTPYESCWEPRPAANSRFTAEEQEKIARKPGEKADRDAL